jgi:hypothetical protein
MVLRNNTLDVMYFLSNGFIINEDDSLIYNQIKGRKITGYFREGEIYKVAVKGNGESIYFGKDERNRYLGVNKALCSDIDIRIKDKKFNRISFKSNPESSFYPMQQINPGDFLLEGFKWEESRRPPDKEALFSPLPSGEQLDADQSKDTVKPSRSRSSQKEG